MKKTELKGDKVIHQFYHVKKTLLFAWLTLQFKISDNFGLKLTLGL